jgi:SPP1 gp7 family putative phage head morphogenesis protein
MSAVKGRKVDAKVRRKILSEMPYVFSSTVENAYSNVDRWALLDGINIAVDIPRQDALRRTDASELDRKLSDEKRRRRYGTKQLRKQVEETFNVNIRSNEMKKRYREWSQENARLLKDLNKTHQKKVGQAVNRAQQEGWTNKRLEQEIAKRAGITRRRARTIAQDQIMKLHANATESLSRASGSRAYIWETLGDDRVRAEHRKRNGKRYSWNHVHSDGPPGVPVNCRCIARPTFTKRRKKR